MRHMPSSVAFVVTMSVAGALSGCAQGVTQESDPVFAASAASGITSSDVGKWNDAHGWGNHASAGYLTSESDPAFSASPAAAITAANITAWSAPDAYTRAEADARFAPKASATQYLQITSPEFRPRSAPQDIDYLGGQGLVFGGAGLGYDLFAGVHLPDGAIVSSMRCYLRNDDTTQAIVDNPSFVRLDRMAVPDFTSGADTLVEVNIALPAGSGFVQPTANAQTSGNLNVIDNSSYQYILNASVVLNAASGSSLFDPMFRGCRIAYTLP